MKHYLDLIGISAKVKKKQSRMIRICIILAVFLVTAIFSMADMEMRNQRLLSARTDGVWHAVFRSINPEQAALITARPEITETSWYAVMNYRLDKSYRINDTETVICGFDQSMAELLPAADITEGTFPAGEDEAAVTKSVKQRLGVKIGDTITLQTPDGADLPLRITGFTGDTSLLTDRDAFGLFMGTALYRQHFADVTAAEDWSFYTEFTPYCHIENTITDIQQQLGLEDRQIGRNTKFLALMFQSSDSYMLRLYLVAAVLAVLVTVAGVLMITSSLNSNISQRTAFFGMLRCLGATRRQTIRFVRREALIWCKTAIPIGIAAGVVVTWVLCVMLKYVSPTLFADLPLLAVSWPGIASGALLGLINVLLAAQAPAKRAAGVSPLTAISGNAGKDQRVRRAAGTKHLRVSLALGIHHARGSRKNFLLMTGSFAFSVVLFLSFSTAVNFMSYALTGLQPYAPDVSIISADNTCSIDAGLARRLSDNPVVKRVFGRSFGYDIEAEVDGTTRRINLVSYEDNQFGWADDMLLEGDLADVKTGKGVLTVFHNDNPLGTGTGFTINGNSSAAAVTVAGILEKTPFDRDPGVETVICSEALFHELMGTGDYTIIDIQLTDRAADQDVAEIREMAGPDIRLSDKRIDNQETKGTYYSFALFLYGFLAIIALISIFNIINSISMSVSARMKQYGAMHAIGMSNRQMTEMMAAEAVTYLGFGLLFGCLIGLPIHRFLFENLITERWGDPWYFPGYAFTIIVLCVIIAVILAVYTPAKRIRSMSVIEQIEAE